MIWARQQGAETVRSKQQGQGAAKGREVEEKTCMLLGKLGLPVMNAVEYG